MKTSKRLLLVVAIYAAIIVFAFSGCTASKPVTGMPEAEAKDVGPLVEDSFLQPFQQVEPVWEPVEVKGIYLTGNTAGSSKTFDKLFNIVKSTELNAMVIDVKDDTGKLTYESDLPMAAEIGANSKRIRDIRALVERLNDNGIYPIARIVVFKDPVLSEKKPEWAVRHKNGGLWKDRKGKGWSNPYLEEVWDYNIAVAEEAAKVGFKEIQFDYVRFPSDGNTSNIVYDPIPDKTRREAIKAFLAYARKRLNPRGVYISADTFGLINSTADDMGIGQFLEDIAQEADYICPMVYPSHYGPYNYGIPNPNSEPYKTVYSSLMDAVKRLEKMENNISIIRPWLQDFTLGYHYGPEEVRAQIRATYDAGLKEWILWNPANVYTVSALEKADEADFGRR